MGVGFLGRRGKPSGYLLGLFAAAGTPFRASLGGENNLAIHGIDGAQEEQPRKAGTWQQQREQTPGPLDATTEKTFLIPVHICQNTLHQKRPAHGRC